MTTHAFDYTRLPRLPSDLKGQLEPWLNRANSVFTETFAAMRMSLEADAVEFTTGWPLATLDSWAGKPIAFRISLANSQSLLAIPNRLAQELVAVLLGDSLAKELPERDLSEIEASLCELVVEKFIDSVREAWVDESFPSMKVILRDPKCRRSKVFRPDEALVLCRCTLRVQDSDHQWCWMIPLDTLSQVVEAEVARKANSKNEVTRCQLESQVRSMSMPLVVRLGQAQLTAPELARLQVGDLVMLNQRVSDPLKAFFSGKPAFTGWPGRIGNRQAFQMEAEVARRQPLSHTDRPASAGSITNSRSS